MQRSPSWSLDARVVRTGVLLVVPDDRVRCKVQPESDGLMFTAL